MEYEKKYKDALEKARQLCLYPTTKPFINDLQNLFPELEESKDERIRKEIIAFIKKRDRSGCDYDYDKWIAWLEKQGKSDKIVEKAKIEKQRVLVTESDGSANIDWDTRSLKDARRLLECGLQYINTELEKQGKKETLCDKCRKEHPSHSCQDITALGRCALEKQDEQKQKQYDIDILEKHITKDSISELAHTVIVRNGWEIVDAKEQKTAWSEEDEDAIGMAIIALEDMYDEDAPNTTYGGYNLPFNKAAERLKSLKDRYTWKPSDEQIMCLQDALSDYHRRGYKAETLETLLKQLKQL